MNAYTKDAVIRAVKTFVQSFLGAWAVTNFDLGKGAVIASIATAISAVMSLYVSVKNQPNKIK